MKKAIISLLTLSMVIMFIGCVEETSSEYSDLNNSFVLSNQEENELTSEQSIIQSADEEHLASEKAASEKAASEKAASEKAASEKAASEKAASEKAASEKAASKKAASEKAASEKAAQEKQTAQQSTSSVNHQKVTGSIVYCTPSGKRYHRDPDCGGKNSKAIDLDSAISRGLTPCQKCAQ